MKYQDRCPKCAFGGPHRATETPQLPHFGRVDCAKCGRFIKWLPKPDSDPTKYRRPASHHDLVAKFGRGFCEMCLRTKAQLGARETLDGHHVIEFQDGGEPLRENVWILCTACHRLVNWMRKYHGNNSVNTESADNVA